MDPFAALYAALGDHRAGGRTDAIFRAFLMGPGSVSGLHDLGKAELALELLPFPPTPAQAEALAGLGYREEPWRSGWLTYRRVDGTLLHLLDHENGQAHAQRLLWTHLGRDAADRDRYRKIFEPDGREAADAALLPSAALAHVARTGFDPVRQAARLLEPLGIPWMVAAGWALDLHLGSPTRPHEDLDLTLPREAQMVVRDALRAAGLAPGRCGPAPIPPGKGRCFPRTSRRTLTSRAAGCST